MPKAVPYHMSAAQRLISPLMKRPFVRTLILLPEIVTGRRISNKPEDYGAFRPAPVAAIERVAICVSDLSRSMRWYARVPQFRLAGLRRALPDPSDPTASLDLAYFDIGTQREALVLVRRTASDGTVKAPTLKGFFHVAFEMSAGTTAFEFADRMKALGTRVEYGPVAHHSGPGGDGESGGNKAVYVADPDGNWLEFFHGMDSIDAQDNWSKRPAGVA